MNPRIVFRTPSVEEYHAIRRHVGWRNPECSSVSERSLSNSLFTVCLEMEETLIGFGRVVGDGGLFFYVQDLIVREEYRGKGYSKLIMNELLEYIRKHANDASFIGLFSAKGVEGLYESHGFVSRPNQKVGAGMFIPFANLNRTKQNRQ